jgi:sialate O-acetylesterase
MTDKTRTMKHGLRACALAAGLILSMTLSAAAAPVLAPVFNSGAVLQCEMPARVWGTAAAGTAVSLLLDEKQVAETTAEADGRWMVEIPAQQPGGPHALEVRGADGSARVEDVWFGEVWIASGQSNMVRPLTTSEGGEETLDRNVPDIRFVLVPQKTGLPAADTFTARDLAWHTFAPPANRRLSAVAFFFADRIREETGRRIGVLQTAVGGTHAHVWMPLAALEGKSALGKYVELDRKAKAANKTPEQWKKEIKDQVDYKKARAAWEKTKSGEPPAVVPPPGLENPFGTKAPAVLWENMVVPLIPYTARGVIWYQGEANAGGHDEYRVLFPALIAAWRQAWERPDWPFLFVQLAAFGELEGKPPAGDWPALRAAQAFTRDTVPHTGMAVALDSGEKADIHPRFKKPVGERLARLALAQVYGRDLAARGPLLARAENHDGKILLAFDHAGSGLKTSDGQPEVPGFEAAGSDGTFHPATARITGPSTIELTCAGVRAPAAVRYAWHDWVEPPVTLQNADGLPAEPGEIKLPSL